MSEKQLKEFIHKQEKISERNGNVLMYIIFTVSISFLFFALYLVSQWPSK